MTVTAGRQAARAIEEWDGSKCTFWEAVGEPIEGAIREALDTGWATPLYLCWATIYRRRIVVEPEDAFAILKMISKEKRPQLKHVRAWNEYARSILTGALCAMYPELQQNFERVPEKSAWVGAALAAFKDAGRPETNQADAALECLAALLDLIARVHGRNPDSPQSALSPWRRRLFEESLALASCAQCKDARPISFSEVIEGTASQDEQIRAAELLISVCADAVDVEGEDRRVSRFSDIAASRPVRSPAEASEASDGRTKEQHARDIERLLHHFACETPLFSRILEHKLDYKPFEPKRQARQVKSVNSLDQKILLIGPPSVGKSWFLFASSELCQSPAAETQPKDRKYPKISICTIDGKTPDKQHALWRNSRGVSGEIGSETSDYDLVARTEPWGLSAYRIFDAPGEIVGLQARKRGSREDHLRRHVRRINPTILVLMLSDDNIDRRMDDRQSKDCADVEDVCQGLRTVLAALGESAATIPIYLIVNKTDVTLKNMMKDEGVNEQRVKLLTEVLQRNSFDILTYFASSDENSLPDFKSAMRNMISPPRLTKDPAVREFVARTCERWHSVIEAACDGRPCSELFLAFTSSLCADGSDDDAYFPGVNGFWSHLWTSTAAVHAPVVETLATRVFSVELKKNLEKLISRWNEAEGEEPDGLRIPDWPMLHDDQDFARALKSLCEESKGIARRVGSLMNLRGDVLDILHGESSDCYNQVINRLKQFEKKTEVQIRQNIESIMRGLIIELNVDPDRRCMEFSKLELTREDRTWLNKCREQLTGGSSDDDTDRDDGHAGIPDWIQRHMLGPGDIHGYFGCLRDSSIARYCPDQADETTEHSESVKEAIAMDAQSPQELLRLGGGDTVWKLVCNTVHDSETKEADLRNLLWFIVDYGRDLTETGSGERWRNYEMLSHRLLDHDFFLLEAQKKQNEERIDRLASLIELFIALKRIASEESGRSTEFELVTNGSDAGGFRRLVDVPVLCEILERLGFDPTSIPRDKEGIKGCIENLQEVEEKILSVYERRKTVIGRIRASSNSRSEDLKTLLEAEKEHILKYRRSAESMFPTSRRLKVLEIRKALSVLAFFRSSVKYIGDNGPVAGKSESTPEANASAILEAIKSRESGKAGSHWLVARYNDLLSKYVETALDAVVNVHYYYLKEAGYMEQFTKERRDGLERFFEKEKSGVVKKEKSGVVKKEKSGVVKLNQEELKSSGNMPRSLQVGIRHAREGGVLLAEAVDDLARIGR